MTPISKKAFWILLAIVSASTLLSIENPWYPAVVALLFAFFLVLLSGMDTLNHLLFFSIPLSIELGVPGVGEIMFPSELIALIVFGFTALNLMSYRKLWRKADYHPVSGAFLVLWLVLCYAAYESNMLLVSVKSVIIFTLYITTFYLQWFVYSKEASSKIKQAIAYYFAGLVIVCLFTTFKHATFGFSRIMAMRVPPPFFSDHTIYGTCMAFFIPMLYIGSKRHLLTSIK